MTNRPTIDRLIGQIDRFAPEQFRANPDWASLPLFDRTGWRRVRFGDVVRQMKEVVDPASGEVERYVAGEHMESENIHISRWGAIGDGYLGPAFIRRFRKGQVLYGSRRTYLKKVAVAEWDGVTANTTFVLEARQEQLLQELLPWIMLSDRFTGHSVAESKGSTNPYINWPDIAKFEFDLPPIEQQRAITNLLQCMIQVVSRQSSLVEHVTTVASELCASSFTNASGRTQLDHVADVSYGITVGRRDHLPFARRYLRVANVMRDRFDLTEIKSIQCTAEESQRHALERGDVLVVEGHANVAEIGRAAVWFGEPGMLHQNHLIRIRCSPQLSPEYLSLFVNSSLGREYFRRCAKSSSGLFTINSSVVKKLPIPLLSIAKQQSLVRVVEQHRNANDELQSSNMFLNAAIRRVIGIV